MKTLMCLSVVDRRGRPRVAHHSSLRSGKQSSRRFARPARPGRCTSGFGGASAARLRFQKSCNVAEPIPDRGPVDPPEWAADVPSSFLLQDFHAAPTDGGVYVFINPRPRDRGHLRQIDNAVYAVHTVTAILTCPWHVAGFSSRPAPGKRSWPWDLKLRHSGLALVNSLWDLDAPVITVDMKVCFLSDWEKQKGPSACRKAST